MYKNIIFDLDDTLVPCGIFYKECTDNFAYYQSIRTGLPEDLCRKVLQQLDIAAIEMPDAWSRHRFPTTFKATSIALDILLGNAPNEVDANISFDLGNAVFYRPYLLFEGVRAMLEEYTKQYNLFLYTKGDPEVQRQKIDSNNLWVIFPEKNVNIVSKKSPEVLSDVVNGHGLDVEETILVGDSKRDDAGSAAGILMDFVWVANKEKPVWDYDKMNIPNAHDVRAYTIEHILDLPSVLPTCPMVV